MQQKSVDARRLASNPAQWASAEAKLSEEWAEKLFAAWLETWEIQGLPRCHALYRAIYAWELCQLFATRNSTFKGMCRKQEMVGRKPHYYSGAMRWFGTEMRHLANKWERRVRVEARKAMYVARREQPIVPTAQSGSMLSSNALGMNDQARNERPKQAFSGIPGVRTSMIGSSNTNRVLTATQKKKLRVIFGAIQSKLRGPKYCAELDRRGLSPTPGWKEEGCPETYTQAYRHTGWRKRIQDEKYRFSRQYDATPSLEREAIIEGRITRRTRHSRAKVKTAEPA
jgi:hypothetical protein